MKETNNKEEPNNSIEGGIETVDTLRKGLHSLIEKSNSNSYFLSLKKNGLIVNELDSEEQLQQYIQTQRKQEEVLEFVINFNKLPKCKRKIYKYTDIFKSINGVPRSNFFDKGITLTTVSSLILHSIPEILYALGVIYKNGKIIENENIKIMYEPKLNNNHKIEDIQLGIYVTSIGLYNLSFRLYDA